MQEELKNLKSKIDDFIRKYYKNKILKGLIYSMTLLLVIFLFLNLVEFVSWSGILARTLLFYFFVVSAGGLIIYYILIPAFKLLKIGKVISDEEAAVIIGNHFPEIQDKLLNTLQLEHALKLSENRSEIALLAASVEQRSQNLNPVPFLKAIELKGNLKYLKYFLPPFILLLFILLIAPAIVTESSARLIQYDRYFEKPLPFQLTLLNEKLEAVQHDDFIIQLEAKGEEIPAIIYVNDGKFQNKMSETSPGKFEYILKDVNNDVYFTIETTEYSSQEYHLTVFPKPVILSFEINLDYPAYLNEKDELINNSGDLVVPEGTEITWKVNTRDADDVIFRKDNVFQNEVVKNGNIFSFQEMASDNFNYSISVGNEYVRSLDSMSFFVQVIPDEFPQITILEQTGDIYYDMNLIKGRISDDHGFHSLTFYYQKNDEQNWSSEELNINSSIGDQYFSYAFQNSELNLKPGESMSYYFEVRDNDAVNRYKRTKTAQFTLELPGEAEIEENTDKTSNDMKNQMQEALEQISQLNRELEEIQLSMYEKTELDWTEKSKIQNLINQQNELQNQLEQMNQLKKQIDQLDEILQKDPDAQMRQQLEQLQELFDQLENNDLERQLEELRKNLEKFDKEELSKMFDEIQKNNEDLSNKLEQNLELYKQYEFEKKFQEMISELEKMAEKQMKLSDKTAEKEVDPKQSETEQKEIKEEFSEIEKKMENAAELNQELEEPFSFEPDTSTNSDIKNEMDQASDNLMKSKESKAAQNQKNAGSKMEKMAADLQAMMQSEMQSRMGEDAEQIKKLLDNIMDLSFAQEKLMKEIEETSVNDPLNVEQSGKQKILQDDFSVVQDSLLAISKRQVMIQPFILKEAGSVEDYMQRALKSLKESRKGPALSEQQYAVTSLNNLALMLVESLDNMKQSMQSSGNMSGSQKCPNPGSQPGDMESISKMQQQLNQGMNQKSREKGLNGKDGMNGQSEELARMAAQQSEIRKLLQQYLEELQSEGGNGDALNKLLEEMKKTENDLVNRQVSQETLNRQKDIEVRLLRSEKANQEREKDEKRESAEGKNTKKSNQTNDLEYKMNSKEQDEILISTPVNLSDYYKEFYKKYKYKLEEGDGKQ